jgi:nucleotide-binding universal stress UspA family protein
MTDKKIILVPTDFTEVAQCAINHAAMLAGKGNNDITLLHLLNKESLANLKAKGKSMEWLKNELEEMCDDYAKKFNLKFRYVLKEGSIFTEIGDVATTLDAELIVMGTHGVIGMQKLTGAFAIKVIESSKIPTVVVKRKQPDPGGYHKIVVPVDASVETKQKTQQVIHIAKLFNSTVYLYKEAGIDESIQHKIDLNASFFMRYLKEHEIPFEVGNQQNHKKDFDKDLIDYATKLNANLMIILTTKDKEIKDFLLGPVEQKIINNEAEIPVMCVHPLINIYTVDRLSTIANLSF